MDLNELRSRIEKEFVTTRYSRIDVVLLPVTERSGFFYVVYTAEYSDMPDCSSSVKLTEGEYVVANTRIVLKVQDRVKRIELES